MIKQVQTRPESGNFVAVWEHAGQVWSTSFHDVGGEILAYDENSNEYFDTGDAHTDDLERMQAIYFVVE